MTQPTFEVRLEGVALKDVPFREVTRILRAIEQLSGHPVTLVGCRDEPDGVIFETVSKTKNRKERT